MLRYRVDSSCAPIHLRTWSLGFPPLTSAMIFVSSSQPLTDQYLCLYRIPVRAEFRLGAGPEENPPRAFSSPWGVAVRTPQRRELRLLPCLVSSPVEVPWFPPSEQLH